jgi:nitrous oxidase accessory protein NosD
VNASLILPKLTLRCQGNVKPSAVVKLSSLGDFSCVQCTAATNEVPFGIAQNYTKGAQGTPFASVYAGETGDEIEVWAPGSVCQAAVKQESVNINAGNSVGSNANGEIVTVNTGWAVGWLLEGGTAARRERLRIFVFPHLRSGGSQS